MTSPHSDKEKDKKDHNISVAIISGCFAILAAAVGAFVGIYGKSMTASSPSAQISASFTSSAASSSTSPPGPTSSASPPLDSAPSAQCTFLLNLSFFSGTQQQCTSSNPEVILNVENSSSCSYSLQVNWGDGSSAQAASIVNYISNPELIAGHQYEKPGEYHIVMNGSKDSGGCVLDGFKNYSSVFTYG